MEIERKFLVRNLPPNLSHYDHCEVEQAYLCQSPTLRVRRMGDAYILTVKEHRRPMVSGEGGGVPVVNREEEFVLSRDNYLRLRDKADGLVVSKTRYRIPLERSASGVPLVAELDVFHGVHEGLLLVEVEFPDVESAVSFVPPTWFAADVSQDSRYRNSSLACRSVMPSSSDA